MCFCYNLLETQGNMPSLKNLRSSLLGGTDIITATGPENATAVVSAFSSPLIINKNMEKYM